MKRLLTTTLFAVLSLAAAVTGRAQAGGMKADPPPPPRVPPGAARQVPVDQGRLAGGIYTSDFFGVSFAVPQGWVAQDAAARKAIVDRGREVIEEGATETKKQALEAAMTRTFFLLSLSKYEPGKPSPDFNAMLMCIAERVPSAVIKTEADYIALSLRTLQGTSARATMSGPVRTEKVGGATFGAADIKMTLGSIAAVQKYYVRLMKGHALVFVYTYVDEGDVKTFDDILKSVSFK